MHLSKTVCIVTGGASGIGLAFVKKALASGAYVVIADVQSPKEHLVYLSLLKTFSYSDISIF